MCLWIPHHSHPLWHTGGSGATALEQEASGKTGRRGSHPSHVVQREGQAALVKIPALRVFMVQNCCAVEARPEGLNLQLTQMTVVIMQPLQPQASSAHHIWVWLGPAGTVQEVWQQSRTTLGCSKREPWCPAGLCLGTGGRKRRRRGSGWLVSGPG